MTGFGAISYAVVGLLYIALSLILLTSWRGRQPGGFLIVACLASSAWGLVLGAQLLGYAVPPIAVFAVEVVRTGAWMTFLAALLGKIGLSSSIKYAVHGIWLVTLVTGFVVWFLQGLPASDQAYNVVGVPGGLILSFAGLVLIEQLYRNSPQISRRGVRLLALGLGGIFSYDLFLFSQGVLFGAVDTTTWLGRGAVNVLFIPLIAISARRNPDWNLDIFVSRQVVFYSTSLIAVGLYLLLMGVGGYALLIYGSTWGALAQTIFFAGAILVLVALLFSNTLRARTKVFLSKHFFRNKYDYREEWLRLISTLTEYGDGSARDIVTRAIAQIVDSPGGVLWAYEENDRAYQVIASHNYSGSAANIAEDSDMIQFIKKDGWLIDLEEFRANRPHYDNIEIPDWLANDEDAWLIVPLMFRYNLFGLVMLRKAPGLTRLNYEDRDLLKTVGNHLAVHLAQEKTDSLLTEARQFDAYHRLTAFLMHDLNNLVAQQTLIIKNAEKHKRNPDFVDDAMQTIANSVERMNRIMHQLKRGEADRSTRVTELRFVVSAAVDRCKSKDPEPSLDLNGVDVLLEVDTDQFTMVLTHLIQNAQEATPPGGQVSVRVERDDQLVRIIVADTGCGMSEEFVRNHLFRPFDSTKGSQGMGIGAYQAREFARKMGGDLKVESVVSRGTCMTLILPVT